jgi:hypothetical protein
MRVEMWPIGTVDPFEQHCASVNDAAVVALARSNDTGLESFI